MNKEDQEKSLAESLDNSIKNITGIQESSATPQHLKESMLKGQTETSKILMKTDSKDFGSSLINSKKEQSIKSDDKFFMNNNTTLKTGNQIKLPAKQISGTIAKDRVTGQYVLIQPGGGPAVPVRLASNTGSNAKQVSVQVIRKGDGTLVPIKTNKSINLNNVNLTGKKIINSGQTVLLNKSASVTGSTNTASSSSIIKTSTTLPASTNAMQKQQVVKAVPIAGDKAKYLTNSSTLVNIGNKFVVRTDNNKKLSEEVPSTSVPKISSQKFIKLSPSTSTAATGNVQTLQLTGKQGGSVQYVRLLNAGASKESISPTKVFVKKQDGHIRMVTRVNQQPLLDGKTIIIKDSSNKISHEVPNQQKFTTVPMLRKINETSLITPSNNKFITVKKDEVEQLNARLKQKVITTSTALSNTIEKPRILNNLGRLTGNLSVSSSHNIFNNQIQRQQILNKKDQTSSATITNLNRPVVSNIKISPKKSVASLGSYTILKRNTESPSPPQPKLYSVLKPSSQNIDDKPQNINNSISSAQSSLPQSFSEQKTRSPSPNNDNGLRRKHCNCTKSQCLKLYCDCFASGEFCQDCNCKECFNNLEYEDERQKAIKMCLERNPAAFKPKITKARDQQDLRLHNKGCNCKRSGCLKNYCECYEAKIVCSSNCKCIGCRNVENRGGMEINDVTKISKSFVRSVGTKRPYEEMEMSGASGLGSLSGPANKSSSIIGGNTSGSFKDLNISNLNQSLNSAPSARQAYNFITQDVVDATIQCMIAQADECQKSEISPKATERMILEELGRCLVEIIDFSIKNFDN